MVLYFAWQLLKSNKSSIIRLAAYLLVSVLAVQVSLGIFTLINCVGTIPVGLGVLHQAGAIAFLSAILFVDYQLLKSNPH
jgi:cytochrome c oxidase assembly protein subunit 15